MKKFFFLACAALALCVACTEKPEQPAKASLSVSPLVNYIECGAQDVEITIKTNDSWTAELTGWSDEEETDWATLNAEGGDGNFTLKVSVAAATSLTTERFVFVTIKTNAKTAEAKITQKTLALAKGEVLIAGMDGISRIWSIYNLADAGKFTDDIQAVGSVFMFNSKKAWTFDLAHNRGDFGGATGATNKDGVDLGMVPVAGYMDAVNAYVTAGTHKKFKEDGTSPADDDDAWLPENDPCPAGYRVPTVWELIQTIGWSDDHCKTKDNFNCIRVNAGERGFSTTGAILGWGQNVPEDVTADNIIEKGGMFIPFSGWISSAGGYIDRNWLLTLWSSTSHNDTMAGLYLTTFVDYCDHWGWGDGHKDYATAIRCIKK